MRNTHLYIIPLLTIATLGSCSDDFFEDGQSSIGSQDKIQLSGEIDQLYLTRVNDDGFCDGDAMGTYIVDYDGEVPGTLQLTGNRADNLRQTYNEADNKWVAAYDVYWKDKHTAVDIYGYYPYGDPTSIEANAFTVQSDQSTETEGKVMGGYEASDFLWGKVSNVAPTSSTIRLPLSHRMANVRVTLVEGDGFSTGEWASLDKIVLIPNLTRKASINMATGEVTASGSVESTATTPAKKGDEWRAIVVPQSVKAETTLFSITLGGLPYKFSKSTDFTYTAGKMSNFSIRVDKKIPTGQYQLTLISESITAWENDQVSHDATAKEYVIITSTRNHLKDSIAAAGKDYTKIRNLKIKGEIDTEDYYFMRDEMTNLQALNLKEVTTYGHKEGNGDVYEGCITCDALKEKTSLLRIVLPDKLKIIGSFAFFNCQYLTGSLTIPEGVTSIKGYAFYGCSSLMGTLTLPSTLETVETEAFMNCSFISELNLPEGLKYIGENAFANNNFYGSLVLPEGLEHIGAGAFQGLTSLTGNLIIPQSIKEIPDIAFSGIGCNGVLKLHDGITYIGESAFSGSRFRGELVLPKNLTVISKSSFSFCNFSGELHLPDNIVTIGNDAFALCQQLRGVLTLPEGLLSIGEDAFGSCGMLEGIVFPESVETIKSSAFNNCFDIGSIVCKGTMPPTLMSAVFDGVAKDNFTLEVPETALNDYKTATGWCDFKRIAAHHELTCSPSAVCALNASHSETMIIRAEGDWEVQSKPSWCSLSQTSGSKKTEIILTVSALAKGATDREGEIVFKLKDTDYTHSCTVKQYNYTYAEDEWICLQSATKGSNGGINVVILGDGYDAEDISSGTYLENMKQEVEYLFDIEPYKTYRDYFNIYTAIPLSQETGVETENTIINNKFGTRTSGSALSVESSDIFAYALACPTVTQKNLGQTLIIMVPNTVDYGGVTEMWADGTAIAICPMSDLDYPLDARGIVQHEAGGHGFGKLADEYIYHSAYIDLCNCFCCTHVDQINVCKANGWYDNISLTGKMHEVPWSHLIFDDRYSSRVDIYEGAYMHTRGVFRSEQTSCMNNNIPYFSAISRESIVKRIKQYAGETFEFEDFVANDVMDAASVTRSTAAGTASNRRVVQTPPVIHKGKPTISKKKTTRRR